MLGTVLDAGVMALNKNKVSAFVEFTQQTKKYIYININTYLYMLISAVEKNKVG